MIRAIINFLIIIFIIIFSFLNRDIVEVAIFPGYVIEIPKFLLIIVMFLLGAILASSIFSLKLFIARTKNKHLSAKYKQLLEKGDEADEGVVSKIKGFLKSE